MSSLERVAANTGVHYFSDSGEAYDNSQWSDDIKSGDVLVIPSEGVVGILFQAWPTAVTKEVGHFHSFIDPSTPPSDMTSAEVSGLGVAKNVALDRGFDLQDGMSFISARRRHAHVSADPTVVNHCVFCGSGNLTGRSDGGIDCGLCNRTFTVMEQPLYSNMPATDSPAGIPATPFDPLMQEAPFADDPNAAPVPGEEEGGDDASSSEDGGDESDDDKPAFFASRKGVPLNEDDFVLHHALRTQRGE